MYKLFVDLDGVLVDFDKGVTQITGKKPEQLDASYMWSVLAQQEEFYATLPWTHDGRKLWDTVRLLNPTVLTGLPEGNWARNQKLEWCARELGKDVPVLTCRSKDKAKVGRQATDPALTPILIDDRSSLRESWEGINGIFIHHTSGNDSIRQLKEAHIIK